MATASASTIAAHGYTIRVEVQARATNLDDDAQRAADAAAAWLDANRPTRPMAELCAEFAAAANGGTDGVDSQDTEYGRMINTMVSIATDAATEGWARREAFVTVDVE